MYKSLLTQLEDIGLQVYAYADDVAFLCSSWQKVEEGIKVVQEWSDAHNMVPNPTKSGILPINGHERAH